jgi:hypothetical protein
MNKKELLKIYSDYLLSAFGPTTGTGLAELHKDSVSHNQVQRFSGASADSRRFVAGREAT